MLYLFLNFFVNLKFLKNDSERIIDYIGVLPLCPYCGKPVEYVGKPSLKFRKYSSKPCANLDPANQSLRKSLTMQRWGYESPSLSPDVKKKISTSLKLSLKK